MNLLPKTTSLDPVPTLGLCDSRYITGCLQVWLCTSTCREYIHLYPAVCTVVKCVCVLELACPVIESDGYIHMWLDMHVCLLQTCQERSALGHDQLSLVPSPDDVCGVGGACAWSGARHDPSCHPLPWSWGPGPPRPCPPPACTAGCLGPSLFLLPVLPSSKAVTDAVTAAWL